MLNESLVIKYFKKALKGRVFLENYHGDLYITDTNIIIKIPGNPLQFKLFNDHAMFPELPGIGESYTYSKLVGFNKQGPSCYKLIKSLLDNDYKPLTVTPWILETGDKTVRLSYCEKTPIFIDTRFLNLFDGHTWHGTDHNKPIIDALNVEDITGVLMPFKVKFEPRHSFPAHLDFLLAEQE